MTDIAAGRPSSWPTIAAAGDETALEAARVAAMGKNGSVTALLKTLGGMTPDERKAQGPAINGLKDRVNAALNARRDGFKGAALDAKLATEAIDVTLPTREAPTEMGRVHPISQVVDELTAIFADMGFAVAEGPDIETDDYNFTKLNFPEGHPAREMHDTFYFNPKPDGSRLLLRTHTSPVQIRTMLTQKPPIRVIIPGRTYRCDSDQTHTPMFHQVEGLVIDKGSHLGHLKWILEEFCKAFFEVEHVKMRFRPSFFPFTEPSLEVDIQCRRDKGEIRFGEGEDWLEISRLRHGASGGATQLRHRPRNLPGLRLGHGDRPHRHAQIRHAGPAPVLRGRHALARPLRLPPARPADLGRRVELMSNEPDGLPLEGRRPNAGGACARPPIDSFRAGRRWDAKSLAERHDRNADGRNSGLRCGLID